MRQVAGATDVGWLFGGRLLRRTGDVRRGPIQISRLGEVLH